MARAEFQTTVQSTTGDIQAGKTVVLYEIDGTTPLAQTVYDAASGGSAVLSPQTNSVGQLDLYADNGQYFTYKVNNGTLQKGRLDPDPGQIVLLTATQTLTNKVITTSTINTSAISGGTLTDIASESILGTLRVAGTGTLPTVFPGWGFNVLSDGTIGMLDSATGLAIQAGTLIEISRETSSAVQVLDLIFRSHYQGTVHTSNLTATAATATSLTVNGAGWSVDQFLLKAVRTDTGTGSGQQRFITGNTSDTISWSTAMSPAPTAGTVFSIVNPGDLAALRLPTSVMSDGITSLRSIEAHRVDTIGGVPLGSVLQLGYHTAIAPPSSIVSVGSYVQGIIDLSADNDVTVAAGTATVPLQYGLLLHGLAGFSEFVVGYNASNVKVLSLTGDGYLNAVRSRIGDVTLTNTNPLTVKQNTPSQTGGVQVIASGSANYSALYTGGDNATYLHPRVGGADGSLLVVGGTTATPALLANGMSGLTAKIISAAVASAEKASIDASGTIAHTGGLVQTGVISPSQLTANTDNWNPTGLATARLIRASTDASRNLTGIVAQASGTRISLCNVGAFDLVLVHDATSTAANRFTLPGAANVTLTPGSAIEIWYDATTTRWRKVA